MGTPSPKWRTLSLSAPYEAGLSGVQMGPGATAFTRMPRSAYSRASVFVSMPTPALLAA